MRARGAPCGNAAVGNAAVTCASLASVAICSARMPQIDIEYRVRDDGDIAYSMPAGLLLLLALLFLELQGSAAVVDEGDISTRVCKT